MIRVIDLKQDESYVNQYVDLRNLYKKVLMTNDVTYEETKEWLKSGDIEIRCLIENDVLIGAVILYLKRNAEITFFAKEQGIGIGSRLLNIIEDVARGRKFDRVWAWALNDNLIAQRVFAKNGYIKEKTSKKVYRDKAIKGIEYEKFLNL